MKKAVNHLRKRDAILAGIVDRVGEFRMDYREPDFSTLVRSIVYQQLSGKVARVIYERLAADMPAGMSAEGVLRLRPSRMRALGLSGQKTEYIRNLARLTRDGILVLERLPALSDDEIIAELTQAKGVGVWTAQMFLIFALRRPDVLPVADLGIRSAIRNAYGFAELPKAAEIEALAQPWRPFCSVASWYLWRSLENQAAL